MNKIKRANRMLKNKKIDSLKMLSNNFEIIGYSRFGNNPIIKLNGFEVIVQNRGGYWTARSVQEVAPKRKEMN